MSNDGTAIKDVNQVGPMDSMLTETLIALQMGLLNDRPPSAVPLTEEYLELARDRYVEIAEVYRKGW
ncbi:MAG: hypothetical protein ABI351_14065 [Herbaspirillum sp.]